MASDILPSVGFIGLGRMGKPMALNLVKNGCHLIVYSRSQGPVLDLIKQGATPAGYPGEVAALADIVFTCLPNEAASESVYIGSGGLLEGSRRSNLFVETSTISPQLARRFNLAAASTGASFLDAPISGGVVGATGGTLTIMVGGDPQDFARAKPLLEIIGTKIHRVGDVGQGEVIKLVNQLLVAVHTQAACEAVALATRAGADPAQTLEIMASSWGTSAMLGRTGPRIIHEEFGADAPIRLLSKDTSLIAGLSQELQLALPLMESASKVIAQAMAQGMGESDISSLATLLR